MKSKIALLSDKSEKAIHSSPERILEIALEDFKSGEIKGRKMVLIFLNDQGENYNISTRMSGLRGTEQISLLEVVKSDIIADMGDT